VNEARSKFSYRWRRSSENPLPFKETRARADVWIDNAVYGIRKGDLGGVYRHTTQENRKTSLLELDLNIVQLLSSAKAIF